ncbi:Phosphotransferase enzyme family protein [Micromonospora sp. MW-13]|uniref:aminoglycoside phosphotransferase family protein n=1 Tax=Micromonospora sp. MW-13 TaxID=2094022 RepID=UPI000ED4915D|nr:aminoglycoside phosphotransferase family protein [Micromonospora sp. MW-13]RGC69751.1 Phosphotransferase enzyme family protein [Micromonospora sp. MW-13]
MAETGRFTEKAMTAAMHQVAAGLGVPTRDARLLRLTNNAVFALPSAAIVIRIARTHQLYERVNKVVRLAHWFAHVDAPAIRLAADVEQPVQVGRLLASVWKYVPPTLPAPTAEDLGRALREFHMPGVPPFPLPMWDPIGDARRRLDDAEGLGDHARDFLVDWCNRLEPRLAALRRDTEGQLIHGDAHVGNLLREPSGRAVLCDFDATCVGPRQVDLVAVAVGEARFGGVDSYQSLADTYGYDVTTDPSWPLLREARELKMIVAAVPLLASSASIVREFTTRLRSVMEGNHQARWTPFANLIC